MSQDGDLYPKTAPEGKYIFVHGSVDCVTVLERVDPDRQPDHMVKAHTRCLWCNQWCWLGDASMEMVVSGEASPICLPCAEVVLPGNVEKVADLENTVWEAPQ